MSVAVNLGDVSLQNGHVDFPPEAGGEFQFRKGTNATSRELLPTAEQAAVVASRVGGTIAGSPELVMRDLYHAPQDAIWRLPLSAPVSATLAGGVKASSVQQVFVARDIGGTERYEAYVMLGSRSADTIWVSSARDGGALSPVEVPRRSSHSGVLQRVQRGGAQ